MVIWRNADGSELHPHTNYYVGGNTKFYGAALFRLREEDFDKIKHYGGVSPAWPISYDEVEPYYAEAERIYHVHGRVGEDPTEPRRLPLLRCLESGRRRAVVDARFHPAACLPGLVSAAGVANKASSGRLIAACRVGVVICAPVRSVT